MNALLGLILILIAAALEASAFDIARRLPPGWGGWAFAVGTSFAIGTFLRGMALLLGGNGGGKGGSGAGSASNNNWFFWSTIIGSQDYERDEHHGGGDVS